MSVSQFKPFPSWVPFQQASQEIVGALSQYSFLLIRGKKLSGKTTLLQQLALQLQSSQRTVYYIGFQKKVPPLYAIQSISKLLGISSSETTASGENYQELSTFDHQSNILLDRLVEHLNSKQAVLLIDNLDFIENVGFLIEFFLENLKGSAVLGTAQTIPEFDKTRTLDTYIYQHRGMNFNETQSLLEKSQANIQKEDLLTLTEKIFDLSDGNPFVVKMILSQSILENRPLKIENLEEDYKQAEKTYYEKVFKQFDPDTQTKLFQTALIEYDKTLESQLLAALPIEVQKILHETGFILDHFSNPLLNEPVRLFLNCLSSFEDQKKLREDLLRNDYFNTEIENPYLKTKEKIFQLLKLNELKKAAEQLDSFAEQMLKMGDLNDFIEFTTPTKKLISLSTTLIRGEALYFLNFREEAVRELEASLPIAADNSFNAKYYLTLGQLCFLVAQYQKAIKYIDYVLKIKETLPTELVGRALIEKALVIYQEDSDLAKIILNEAREKSSQLENSDYFEADIECTLAYIEEFKNSDLAVKHYDKAAFLYGKLHRHYRYTVALLNASIFNYTLGRVSIAKSQKEMAGNLAKKFGFKLIIDADNNDSVYILTRQGKTKEGISLGNNAAKNINIHSPLSHTYRGILINLCFTYFCAKDYENFLKICDQLLANPSLQREKWIFSFYERCKVIVTSFLADQWTKELETTILREKDTPGDFSVILFVYLELSYRISFPMKLSNTILHEVDQITEPVKRHRNSFLVGMYHLLEGEFVKAGHSLENSLKISTEMEVPYWQFRSLVGMATLDIILKRHTLAIAKLQEAETLLNEFDIDDEKVQQPVFLAIAYLLSGDQGNYLRTLKRVNFKSYPSYLLFILDPTISQAHERPVLSTHEKRYCDYLLSCLHLDTLKKVSLKTHQTEIACFLSELPEINPEKYDFIFDETQALIKLKKQQISLREKPALLELLSFLVANIGKTFSKETLCEQVWKEIYNPLVHDTRIYTSIKRLREILGQEGNSEILIEKGGFYGINPKIRYAEISLIREKAEVVSERKERILNYIKIHGSATRPEIEKLLQVSSTLTKKELKELTASGYLKSQGQGKSTKYVQASL